MQCSEKGTAVIRSFEGCALRAYRDSVGVWTIGYGITNFDKWAVAYLGRKIGAGLTITQEQAEYLLIESLRRSYTPEVEKAMPSPAEQSEIDAGVSFHFNTGAIGRASWVKLWKAGAPVDQLKASIMSWSKAGGKTLRGLVRRRDREFMILEYGNYGPEGECKPPRLDDKGRIVTEAASAPQHFLAGTSGMLRIGDKGAAVADLNASLATLGYKVDGDAYTLGTKEAVAAMQSAHPQLTVDGVAGPATRAAINREIAMRKGSKNLTGASGGAGVVAAVADAASGGHLSAGVYVAIALVVVAVAGAFLWKFRDEVTAAANK